MIFSTLSSIEPRMSLVKMIWVELDFLDVGRLRAILLIWWQDENSHPWVLPLMRTVCSYVVLGCWPDSPGVVATKTGIWGTPSSLPDSIGQPARWNMCSSTIAALNPASSSTIISQSSLPIVKVGWVPSCPYLTRPASSADNWLCSTLHRVAGHVPDVVVGGEAGPADAWAPQCIQLRKERLHLFAQDILNIGQVGPVSSDEVASCSHDVEPETLVDHVQPLLHDHVLCQWAERLLLLQGLALVLGSLLQKRIRVKLSESLQSLGMGLALLSEVYLDICSCEESQSFCFQFEDCLYFIHYPVV